MSVYKEAKMVKEEIENNSKQIFNDACDYGVPIYSFNDPIIKMVKDVMINMYQSKKVKENGGQTIYFDGGKGAKLEAGFEKATITYTPFSNRLTQHPSLLVPQGLLGILEIQTH